MNGKDLFTIREESGKHITEITDLARVRQAFGDDLLIAFCRCFIWTDRLMSINFLARSVNYLKNTSVSAKREAQTILWFSCGSLVELARAMKALRRAGIKGFLDGSDLASLKEMGQIIKRWKTDSLFTGVRNKVSFHLDHEVLKTGLERISSIQQGVVFMESEGPGYGFNWIKFAHDLLSWGLFAKDDKEHIAQFFESVANDHVRVRELLDSTFIACLKGIEAGRYRRS